MRHLSRCPLIEARHGITGGRVVEALALREGFQPPDVPDDWRDGVGGLQTSRSTVTGYQPLLLVGRLTSPLRPRGRFRRLVDFAWIPHE